MGKFSGRQITNIFGNFSQKTGFGKKKEKYFKMTSADIFMQSAKC